MRAPRAILVSAPSSDALRVRLADAARQSPGHEWLVLHGARARDEERPGSDWDFAFRATGVVDVPALGERLGAILAGGGEVDVVNVERASGVLRFNVAREGLPLFERRVHAFDDLREKVARFWCEAGAAIHAARAGRLT